MPVLRFALFACLATVSSHIAVAADDCGGDRACPVEGGNYRVELPPNGTANGAYVFFHGYRSSAAAQMRHRALIDAAHAHGLAFVAPDGLEGTWSHGGSPSRERDEQVFIGRVLDDLERRYGFGSTEVVIGGFSQGASMAWYALCTQGDRIAASITFSGVFWEPLPQADDCVAAIPPVVHFHGSADTVFPLEGRPIGQRFRQGSTTESVALVSRRAQCDAGAVVERPIAGIDCDVATGCGRGEIALCIHDGGHQVSAAQLEAALEALGF